MHFGAGAGGLKHPPEAHGQLAMIGAQPIAMLISPLARPQRRIAQNGEPGHNES
jgi:hypothetical protein